MSFPDLQRPSHLAGESAELPILDFPELQNVPISQHDQPMASTEYQVYDQES